MNIAITCGLSDKKLLSKIKPIANIDFVENIFLFRRRPFAHPKVTCYSPPRMLAKNILTAELYRILTLVYVCSFKRVDAIMGIYMLLHGVIAGLVGKVFAKPAIQNLIGKDLHLCLQHPMLMRFVKAADLVVTRGPCTKRALTERGVEPNKISHPPNLFRFDQAPKAAHPSPPDYDLLYVGYLEPYKRIDLLLLSVKKVADELGTDLRVALLGDGSSAGNLRRMTKELGIERSIDFLGEHEDVYPFFPQAKVFIMTSEAEGLPMAMIEAMSCGLPCIVPDDGDIKTVAKHEHNALLVPVGDIDGFARSIKRLLTDPELSRRLSLNALQIRRERSYEYSLENVTRTWTELLKGL